jgi:hypothetical protein
MDSILVVIRLTGLLLVTPANGNGGPMHILFPEPPGGIGAHVAQIGFWKADRTGCEHWIEISDLPDKRGVCYVRLNNSTLTLGREGNSQLVAVPGGNASRVDNHPVDTAFLAPTLQDAPALRALRTRITLHEGFFDDSCALGRFTLRQHGEVRPVNLFNVLRWTYRLPLRDSILELARRRFRTTGVGVDSIWKVSADKSHTIELFIRSIPTNEAGTDLTDDDIEPGNEVPHFGAFYRLLSPPAAGPLPRLVAETGQSCWWPMARKIEKMDFTAGTMSCMVAGGDPP